MSQKRILYPALVISLIIVINATSLSSSAAAAAPTPLTRQYLNTTADQRTRNPIRTNQRQTSRNRNMTNPNRNAAANRKAPDEMGARNNNENTDPRRDLENFFENFNMGALDTNRWFMSGYWQNPQPFNAGFDPSYWTIRWKTLVLSLRKERFFRGGWDAPYTAGELRSQAKYSSGCYSVCMKPSAVSGVSTAFYIQDFGRSSSGEITIGYVDCRASRSRCTFLEALEALILLWFFFAHREIDVEFMGKNTTYMQSNVFARVYNANENSGSGNEQLHNLGFDAAENYAAYSFKWSNGRIDWWVNDKLVRTETRGSAKVPEDGMKMRIAASVWPVTPIAEVWAGELSRTFQETEARYQWIWHQAGPNCEVKMECGENGDPDIYRGREG